MQKINFNNPITGDLTALLIFISFWISLLGITKTPVSGIHFQDDHQILTIQKELSSHKLSEVISTYVKKDLKLRLRPFYYIHRVLITKVLGKNIKYWSLYTGLLAILTSYFLFKFLRLLKFSFSESLLFSFLSLLGPHTCIWWRLGPAETFGTFLLSLTLFFISKSIISRHKYLYITLSLISIILCALTKESFLLFLPSLILFYLFFSSQINKVSWQTTIKKDYLFMFILLILFIFPVIFIFRNIGTNTIGYAGVSNNYFSLDFMKWTIVQLYKNIYFIIILFGFFLIIQNTSVSNLKELIKHTLKTLTDHLFILIIFLAIFLPQCVLYFKSGMETRYFTPVVFGFSILAIYLLNTISSSSIITYSSKFSFLSLIILSIIYLNFKIVVPAAIEFSDEGLQTKAFINNILYHSDKTDKVIFVIDPGSEYEWGFFLKEYFEIELNRTNFQFLQVSSDYSYPPQYTSRAIFIQTFNKYLIKPEELAGEKYNCIAVLPLSNNLFNKEFSYFVKSAKYSCVNNSNFNVYYLNK